jgi:hypothetical protein
METRYFHGDITPDDIARALAGEFNRANLRTQKFGDERKTIIQIGTSNQPVSGGTVAVAVSVEKVSDGVAVEVGKQSWYGVAASLGKTAMIAWRNPLGLLGRLDDIAQDIENLQITDQIWSTIEKTAHNLGANFELSERLSRSVCPYCNTANPFGESNCLACGAPLGDIQPRTCANCGYVIKTSENVCPNCGQPLTG